MAGYTRQSTFADGDTITAALFNNEYNQLLNAFSNTGGHKHDGTANEGPVIGLIGDAGVVTPLNKVLIDSTNDHIEFWIEVSSSSVQQLYIADGAIVPVTDSDIDLGTTSLRFKDTYTDTITTTGNVAVGGNLTVTGTTTFNGGTITMGDAATDNVVFGADVDSNIIPDDDDSYDLGSSTQEWRNLYIDGTANIDSLVADTADINGGTIDGATIATSDITVGSGKTLNVSAGTLTLADNQISGDKVEGGTIAATTITTLASTTGNITTVNSTTTNATTVDSTNLEVTNLKAKDGTAAGSIANSTGVVTLGSSVLTTTDINGGTIDGSTIATSDITVGTGKTLDVSSGTLTLADNQISGDKVEGGTIAATTITDLTFGSLNDGTITITAFADEDDMSSDSATLIPTQQSVKAYVDSQVTAQDLDFQGDTGGALSIDLDSESFTIAGGTGLDTVGSGNTVTVNIDSTVTTLTGTQTLTNKTLTSPVISSISNTGTLTLPTSTDTLVGRATTDTLTNKTLTSPVINTGVSGTAILDEDNMASDSATQLATQQSIKAYVDSEIGSIISDVVGDTTPQLGGDLASNGNDILFADSDKAIFGAGSDLQIYHDGTHSYIEDAGTGQLRLQSDLIALRTTNGETSITATQDAGVSIRHNNITKLETTSTGIDVTGTATMDGLTVDGDAIIQDATPTLEFKDTDNNLIASITGASGSLLLKADTGSGTAGESMQFHTGGVIRQNISAGGDISFYEDTGTTAQMTWDASADALTFTDNTKATFGASSDLQIYHDGSNSYIDDVVGGGTGDLYIKASDAVRILTPSLVVNNAANNENMITAAEDGAATLYHNGSAKIATTSTGVTVTGTATMDGLHVSTSSGDCTVLIEAAENASGSEPRLQLKGTNTSSNPIIEFGDSAGFVGSIEYENSDNSMRLGTNSSERLRIDSSGNVLVGTTDSFPGDGDTNTGVALTASGSAAFSRSGFRVVSINRNTDDGTLIEFNKDGSAVGSIGTNGGQLNIGLNTTSGLSFGSSIIYPRGTGNTTQNNTIDLGNSGNRFKDIHLRGSVYTDLVRGYDDTDTYVNFAGSNVLSFITGASERMRIDSSGKVHIGATSGTGLLNVDGGTGEGSLYVEGTASGSPITARLLASDGGAVFFGSSTNHDLRIQTNGAERMRIDSSGKVGIGCSPSAFLDVAYGDYQNSGALRIGADIGTNTSRTNSTRKIGIISAPHYTNAEDDISLIMIDSESDNCLMSIGGNSASMNSPSKIAFFTSSNAAGTSTGSEAMRIDASGNLLVGNTSSGGSGTVQANIGFDAQDGSNTTSIAIRNYSSAANSGSIIVDPDNVGASSVMYFGIDGITPAKMKLDSAGRLNIDQNDTRFGTGALNITGEVGASFAAIQFRHNASTVVGSVVTTASSTAYNTSSDYRLKENVDYTWDATTRLKQLKPARFNFIADADNTVDGFLAHEVSSIVPEAITGQKDAMMDEEYEITPAVKGADGSVVTEAVMGTHSVPNYQSIDQSKLVPLLVKTIQELEARITALES